MAGYLVVFAEGICCAREVHGPMMYKLDVQRMTRVSVSRLREHLPSYLKRVQAGEAIQITSRGRVIAGLRPNTSQPWKRSRG